MASDQARRPFRARLRAQLSTPAPWLAAALVLLAVAIGLWAWRASGQVLPRATGASWAALLPSVAVALGAGVVVGAVVALLAAVVGWRMPLVFVASWVASAILLATMGAAGAIRAWWIVTAVTLVALPVVTYAAVAAVTGRRPRRRALSASVVAGLALVAVAALLVYPGSATVAPVAGTAGRAPTATTPAADPNGPGPHRVTTLHYGSGQSQERAAYGSEVDVRTTPVDASGIIRAWPASLTEAWGFDASALPLNAVVWRPEGQGPFPLVLVVHGNSSSDSASEEGFDYLGRLLASRGYVVAAIDENALGTSVLSGTATGLDAARPWLVLQHLRQWQEWGQAARGSNPLAGMADLERIALVGHSRGGEAVATAAALNTAGRWPDDTSVSLPHGFSISSVVAIAPSDGVWKPAGRPVQLSGVNYLTVAGALDADVLSFAGARQYARTETGPGTTRAAVLLERMNHSQFNTRWGRHDAALGLARRALSTGALVDPGVQQAAAAGQVSAFLDLTVRDRAEMRPFVDGSLPELPFAPGLTVRRQVDLGGGATMTPGRVTGATARDTTLPTRIGASDIPVRSVTWSGTPREVHLDYAAPERAPAGATTLSVDLADATAAHVDRGEVRLRVTATDGAGQRASAPLGPDGVLPRQLPGTFTTLPQLMPAARSEPTLHTLTVPLDQLDGVDRDDLASVTITLEAPSGTGVFVGEVRLDPGASAAGR